MCKFRLVFYNKKGGREMKKLLILMIVLSLNVCSTVNSTVADTREYKPEDIMLICPYLLVGEEQVKTLHHIKNIFFDGNGAYMTDKLNLYSTIGCDLEYKTNVKPSAYGEYNVSDKVFKYKGRKYKALEILVTFENNDNIYRVFSYILTEK